MVLTETLYNYVDLSIIQKDNFIPDLEVDFYSLLLQMLII